MARSRIEVDASLEPAAMSAHLLNEIFAHAREAEPEECCGLVLGDDAVRHRSLVRCRNDMTRHHKRDPENYPRDGGEGFYMNEQDYLRASDDAEERGERVTAVYHSHIECGAYFSEMDQDFAEQPLFPFPDADHVVVSVIAGKVVDQSLFQRDAESGRFVGRSLILGELVSARRSGWPRWSLGLALAVAGGWLAGCAGAGAVKTSTLPESPIAVLFRTEADALKRLEALEDLEKGGQKNTREGVARLENIDSLLGGREDPRTRLGSLNGRLALVDPRTGKAERVKDAPLGAAPLGWSPDHEKLLMVASYRGGRQLFLWERSTDQTSIVTGGNWHPYGCLGPDDTMAATEFVSRKSIARLVATSADGQRLEPITQGPAHTHPACSPVGHHLAFVDVDPKGTPRIAVIDLRTRAPARIIAVGKDPTFTPDGEWIVYSGPTRKGPRLWRVRPDGTGRTAFAVSRHDESDPAVSPDGTYVTYVIDEQQRDRLWVRRMDGTGARPLVSTGDAARPAW